jgi:septal ring factor EnvC (AmiA/AmiB activator)
MKEKYIPGEGCLCHAHSEAECGCDVDWTPREVYELREQREEARDEIKKLKREVINWKTAHDIAIEQCDRAQSKIENQAERIKYLEGATNHATGTPLSKMREQLDRLAEQKESNHKVTIAIGRMFYEAKEQRDRLAEALRELCETLLADKPRDITELLNKAGDALAAVKG